MQVKAKLSYLRIAPRKVRLVADLIRGKKAKEAEAILDFTVKAGSLPLLKLLKQAVANAKNNMQLDPANLFVARIFVDEGPKLKRWMPRARGQAYEIQKKTSHITIILEEIKKTAGKPKKAKLEKEKPAEEAIFRTQAGQEEKEKKETPKFKAEKEIRKPRAESGLKRMFRRKAF